MNAKQMRKRADTLDRSASFLEKVGGTENLQTAATYRQQASDLRESAAKLERQKERQEA